jgi:uncharacterized membrane-anchored protein
MTGKLKHPVSHGGASGGDEALQRAMIALNSGHPADAERIATDALKTNPRNVPALRVLANALLTQNRIADAIAPLDTAARGNHDPQIETMLGIVLRQDRGRALVAQARGQAAAAACSGVLRVR